MNYLAITIGPVIKTIKQARTTREIWAASFIYSLMMKQLLKVLDKKEGFKIINPSANDLESAETYNGAGIFPDRCQVQIPKLLDRDEIDEIRNEVFEGLPEFISNNRAYFHIYAAQGTFNDSVGKVIKQMTEVLDNAELRVKYQMVGESDLSKELGKKENIQLLYDLGMDKKRDAVFVKNQKRLPSLIELSTRELSDLSDYDNLVTNEVQKTIWNNEEESKSELIIESLKKHLNSIEGKHFMMRHKYFAVVQSDGDGLSKYFTTESTDPESSSEKLMCFSKKAAGWITNYGALPVYIGGDDLFFLAPLVGKGKEEKTETVFDLIRHLDEKFGKELKGVTLSYGISIGYYKFPMSQTMDMAYQLLFRKAKKAEFKSGQKNAMAFSLRKASGKPFGTILSKGGVAFTLFNEILRMSLDTEEKMLTSVMHTLQKNQFLFLRALESGSEKWFFENHFNESAHKAAQGFIEKVQEFSKAVFEETIKIEGEKLDVWTSFFDKKEDVNKDNIQMNIIFSTLRLIQFLNAKDRDNE